MDKGNTGPLPSRIGPYLILEKIGSGGMATVYRATHPDSQRKVAIKVLSSRLVDLEQIRLRFEREARALLQLNHPNILPVYDYGEDGGTPYLVMKLVSARSLNDLLKDGPLPVHEVGLMTRQIASALDYAHARGIIHRDVKPTNILLDANNTPYLADFGVAQFSDTDEVARLTQSGAFVGTASYASPEQCRGEAVDRPSDIYALGVMVFKMATGRLPFEAATPLAVMKLHMYEPPPNPCAYNARLPQELYSVLLKALAKLPAGRYPSAMRFSEDLDVALNLHPPLPGADTDDDTWLVGDIATVQPDRPSAVGQQPAPEASPPGDDLALLSGDLAQSVAGEAAADPAGSFEDEVDFDDVAAGFSDDFSDDPSPRGAQRAAAEDDFDDSFEPDADNQFISGEFPLPEDAIGAGDDEPSDFVVLEALLGGDLPGTDAAPGPVIHPLPARGPIRPLSGPPPARARSRRWTGAQIAVYGSMVVSLLAVIAGAILITRELFSPAVALDATYHGAAIGAAFDYPRAWTLSAGTLAVLSAVPDTAVIVADRPVSPGGPYGGAGLVIAVQPIDPVAVFGVAATCRDRIAAGPEATFDCLAGQRFVTPQYRRFTTSRYAGVQLLGTLPPTRASPPVILLATGEIRWLALAIVYWDNYDGARDVLARMARSVRLEQQPS